MKLISLNAGEPEKSITKTLSLHIISASPELCFSLFSSQKFTVLHGGNWSIKADPVSCNLLILEMFPVQCTKILMKIVTTSPERPLSAVPGCSAQRHRSSQLILIMFLQRSLATVKLQMGKKYKLAPNDWPKAVISD